MAANRKSAGDHMVVVPHTPREDAILRGYETWLREVDNPIFNRMPGVVHYANWRVCAPNPAVPFTNIDFLRLVGEQEAAELATNPELAEHAASWTELWGRYPDASDDDAHLNGHLYLCRRLAGHRPPQGCLGAAPAELVAAPDLALETSLPESTTVRETV